MDEGMTRHKSVTVVFITRHMNLRCDATKQLELLQPSGGCHCLCSHHSQATLRWCCSVAVRWCCSEVVWWFYSAAVRLCCSAAVRWCCSEVVLK